MKFSLTIETDDVSVLNIVAQLAALVEAWANPDEDVQFDVSDVVLALDCIPDAIRFAVLPDPDLWTVSEDQNRKLRSIGRQMVILGQELIDHPLAPFEVKTPVDNANPA